MAHAPAHNRGFSLAEVLVAMAIFVTVMAGVVALYQGAISTVLQGRQSIQAFEQARGALDVMESDLRRAFTRREYGDAYQFYGRPEGFAFVGTLPGGGLGRITYVIHPTTNRFDRQGNELPAVFQTSLAEKWSAIRDNVQSQVFIAYRAAGFNGDAANNEALNALALFFNAYPAPGGGPDSVVEFTVNVQSSSLLRYEEGNVSDLETFVLPAGMQWPNIDPNPRYGIPDNDSFPAGSPEFPGLNEALYEMQLSAINPRLTPNTDMRKIVRDSLFSSDRNDRLYAINGDTISGLLASRKRETWILMLAQSPTLDRFGLPSFWLDKEPRDYVVTENILHRAELVAPDGNLLVYPGPDGAPILLDALNVEGAFSYRATANGQDRSHFNDLANIAGYDQFALDPGAESLGALDRNLQQLYGGLPQEADVGTPLQPRLPELVNTGFWLIMEKPTVGAPDFRRWFNMQIEVPAAVSRTTPPRFTPNYDQSPPPPSSI